MTETSLDTWWQEDEAESAPPIQVLHFVTAVVVSRNGAEWWVDDTTLNFTKRTLKSPIKLKWGTTLQRFSARFSGAARVGVRLHEWFS